MPKGGGAVCLAVHQFAKLEVCGLLEKLSLILSETSCHGHVDFMVYSILYCVTMCGSVKSCEWCVQDVTISCSLYLWQCRV